MQDLTLLNAYGKMAFMFFGKKNDILIIPIAFIHSFAIMRVLFGWPRLNRVVDCHAITTLSNESFLLQDNKT